MDNLKGKVVYHELSEAQKMHFYRLLILANPSEFLLNASSESKMLALLKDIAHMESVDIKEVRKLYEPLLDMDSTSEFFFYSKLHHTNKSFIDLAITTVLSRDTYTYKNRYVEILNAFKADKFPLTEKEIENMREVFNEYLENDGHDLPTNMNSGEISQ